MTSRGELQFIFRSILLFLGRVILFSAGLFMISFAVIVVRHLVYS